MAELAYKDLLKRQIKNSGLSLREISRRTKAKGTTVSQSYLSMIINGDTPPPSEQVTKVLCEVIGVGNDTEKLIWYGYMEKAPHEVQPIIRWYYEHWSSFVSSIQALVGWNKNKAKEINELDMENRVSLIMDAFNKLLIAHPKLLEESLPVTQVKVVDLLHSSEYFEWIDQSGIEDGEYIYVIAEDNSMNNAGIIKGSKVLVKLTNEGEEILQGSIYFLSLGAKKLLRRVYKDENGQMVLVADNPSYQPLLVNNPDELQLIGLAKSVKLMITN